MKSFRWFPAAVGLLLATGWAGAESLWGRGTATSGSSGSSTTGTSLTLDPGRLNVGYLGIATDGGVAVIGSITTSRAAATAVGPNITPGRAMFNASTTFSGSTGPGGGAYAVASEGNTTGGSYFGQTAAAGSNFVGAKDGVGTTATLTAEGSWTLASFVSSTIASGSVAFQSLTGAKTCIGTGATACTSTLLGFGMAQTDQSADCDGAATGNEGSGKICIAAAAGSMVLTNSAIGPTSIIQLTNVSDDATCISGYATVGAGSATIGCVGAGNATANTIMSFVVFNP